MVRGLIFVVVAFMITACSVTPAAPGRGTITASAARSPRWPERDVSRDPFLPVASGSPVVHLGCVGQGHLYTYGVPRIRGIASTGESFMFLSVAADGMANLPALPLYREDVPVGSTRHSRAPVNMRLLEPAGEARGTVVQIVSYARWSDQERALSDEFVRRGWRVLVAWPSEQTWMGEMWFYAVSDDPTPVVREMARGVDDYLADVAYAVEAGLTYLSEQGRVRLEGAPLVLVGSSAGAIHLPAVAARLQEAGPKGPDAAVLIAGGVDLMGITCSSPLTYYRVCLLKCVGPDSELKNLTEEERTALLKRALDASQLDPEHTAACLLGVPVLQLRAVFDGIIDDSFADRLYDRLGQPERWSYLLGHTGLFFILPFEADDIAWWIEQHTARVPPASPTPLP